MRILYLTAESYDEPIIQSQVLNLLERIARHDTISSITLLTFDDAAGPARPRPPVPGGIVHVGTPDRGTVRNVLFAIRYVWTVRKQYDLVHVRSYLPMFAGVLAKLLLRKRVLFDPRGLFAEEQSYGHNNWLTTFLFKQFERLFCAVADAIVVVSTPFREHLVGRYAIASDLVSVIPTFSSEYAENGRSPTTVDVRARMGWTDAKVFVYSGSLGKWQMIEQVVAFFRHVARRLPDARFLFLSHPDEALLSLLARTLPEGTYGLLRVPSKELSACLAQCDYGVLFRSDHIVNRVSAPIKVKDYLVAGLPVIMSDQVGDSSDFVREHDCGFVLQELTPVEMERAVDAIERRPAWDRRAITAVARSTFDIAPVTMQYHRLYMNLLKRT